MKMTPRKSVWKTCGVIWCFTGLDGTSPKGTVRLDLQSRQGKCSGRAAFACFARSRVLPCPLAETFGTSHFGGRPCCPACLGITALRRSLSFLLGGSSMTRWSREDMGFFMIFLIVCQVSHLEQLLPNRLCFQQGWIRAARNMSESSGSFLGFKNNPKHSKTGNMSPQCATLSHVILRNSHILLPDVPVLFPAFIASRSMQNGGSGTHTCLQNYRPGRHILES